MNTRRKFIIQGSLATTAMLALKPMTTIARVASPFAGLNGKLVFLHTANLKSYSDGPVIQYIKNLKSKNAGTILLEAGQDAMDETGQFTYDVSIHETNDLSAITGDYKIIAKGNHRTGFIMANPGESDIVQKINSLSAYLKKEKNCTLVVCMSRLGYKNENAPDDFTLAKKSTHLDIIIGGHAKNFQIHPDIVLNRNNVEVIIHSASGDPSGYGLIEFEFDRMGQKKQISFTKQLAKNISPDRAMPAA